MSDTTIESFYNQLYNLAHIQRYSIVPRIKSESVAEHSFFVAAVVIRLHKEYDFDLGRAVAMATIHDWTESWVDDITVATKRKFPKLKAVVAAIEEEIAEKEFPQPVYELWLEHKECITVEAKIVHYADVLQVIQYSNNEIKLGNTGYMEQVNSEACIRANKLELALEQWRI